MQVKARALRGVQGMCASQHLPARHGTIMRQWRRLVLYALTDTLTAYLQRQDLDVALLLRYLRSPDSDRYITREHRIDAPRPGGAGGEGARHLVDVARTAAARA
jgi:hypothetical protein